MDRETSEQLDGLRLVRMDQILHRADDHRSHLVGKIMVTEEDRRFAREYAPKIAEHMRKRPYGAINHMATEISLEEAIRRGLLTECAYAHVFGGEPCVELLPNGDGGRDFWIYLRVGFIPWRFKVNVKTKSVQ